MTGEVPDIDVASASKVQFYVNGTRAGTAPVESDGTFQLARLLLTPGDNQITAFAISETGLQSDSAIPQVVVVDTTSPSVEFVALPRLTAEATLPVRTRYRDDTDITPESVTLTVNGEEVAVDIQQNEAITTVELTEGENKLSLSAMDAAGNASDLAEATITLDTTPPATAPANRRAGTSFSGTEVILNWDADSHASAYNLYQGQSPIVEIDELTPVATNLKTTHFTDVNVNLGVTYYYALTSINGAGVEGVKISDNVNITILFAPRCGTAFISDGTRFTAPASGIAKNPILYTGIALETSSPEELPPLDKAIDGTARHFVGTSQSGDLFTESFVLPATISLPYPAEVESPETLGVFFLDNSEWTQVKGTQVDAVRGVIIANAFRFGTYQLAKPTPRPWDVTQDGIIDIADLAIVAAYFGETVAPGNPLDVKADGIIDISDLTLIGIHLGENYGGATATPSR